jgi:c(7)-type cytochrome triheme protein
MNKKSILITLSLLLLIAQWAIAQDAVWWKLPPLPPPELYGNILIDRASTSEGVKPVTFSHWSHRTMYTCKVCHAEIEFNMMINATMITEEANKYGLYCGACHDGKTAFGHTEENCDKCHNGDITYGKEKFKKLSNLPKAPNGNGIDWVKALEEGLIKPRTFLKDEIEPIDYVKKISIETAWAGISPVVFEHVVHGKWLDCSNCHPEIFNIEREATEGLAMEYILKYEYCGVCHGRVAFPPNDNCKKCHPKMKHPGKAIEKVH